jgi:hypothetical protein
MPDGRRPGVRRGLRAGLRVAVFIGIFQTSGSPAGHGGAVPGQRIMPADRAGSRSGGQGGAPADVGEGRGAWLRWMFGERRRTLPKPSRVGRRGPPGPDRARAAAPVPSLNGITRSVESTERRRRPGPRRAHAGACWGPRGAHWGPCWGPCGVGRIIPLRLQGMGRKSAFRAQGAHWGPPGCQKVSKPLPLSLGLTGPAAHTGPNREGHPVRGGSAIAVPSRREAPPRPGLLQLDHSPATP